MRTAPIALALWLTVGFSGCGEGVLHPSSPSFDVVGAEQLSSSFTGIAIDLGTLGGNSSYASHVNEAGQIAGTSTTSSGETHAFLWQNGVMTDLGTLGGTSSGLAGVKPSLSLSNAGHVIGRSTIAGDAERHSFIWYNGVMTDLGTLGGTTGARAVNASGQVVGGSYLPGDTEQHAFLWENDVMIDLGTLGGAVGIATAINDAGQIAGRSTNDDGEYRIFLWENETDGMIDLENLAPGMYPNFAVAYGLNEAGQMIGRTSTWSGPAEQNAFLWDGETMKDLGNLGGSGARASNAYALNEEGQVVGGSYTAGNAERHAFLYDENVMTDLGTLGGTNSYANAINDAGQIVGSSTIAGDVGSRAVLWEGGEMIPLGTLGGTSATATDINESGWIVGSSTDAAGDRHAVLWRPGEPTEQLDELDDIVEALSEGQDAVLTSDQAAGLLGKINEVMTRIENGRTRPAANQLNAFIRQVEGFVAAGVLTSAVGQQLINQAEGIVAQLAG